MFVKRFVLIEILVISLSFASIASPLKHMDKELDAPSGLVALESARVALPTAKDLLELRSEIHELSARVEQLENVIHEREAERSTAAPKAAQKNETPNQKPVGKLNKLWRSVENAGRVVRRCITKFCRNWDFAEFWIRIDGFFY